MKILISGFEPFLNVTQNPSQIVVEHLSQKFNIECIILPVVYGKSFQILHAKMNQVNPDYVLMFGVAQGRNKICFERIGLNWTESSKPDNSGRTYLGEKIIQEQELALMTDFPFEKLYLGLGEKLSLITSVSHSAGTYVCNDLYFRVLNSALTSILNSKKLFIHIPEFQVMPFADQIEIFEQMIIAIQNNVLE